jgi:hypothetical protein
LLLNLELTDTGNLNVLSSSATGVNANINVSTNQAIVVSGAVTSGGTATFRAGSGIAANAQVTAPGGLTYGVTSGTITSPLVITNPGPISLTAGASSIGALSVNTPQLTISANGATITDTYTGYTTLATASGNPDRALGNLVFNSAGSTLAVNHSGVADYLNVTIDDTNAAGSILLNSLAISASNVVTISAVGNITAAQSATQSISATTINFTTKDGNIIGPAGGKLLINAANASITGSSTASTVSLSDSTVVNLTGVTANNFTLYSVDGIDVAGKVSAVTLSLNGNVNVLQTTSTGLLSGTDVTIRGNIIGSTLSANGLNVALTGAGAVLNLIDTDIVAVQSAGSLNLGTGQVAINLNVISGGTLSQSGTLVVQGSASLTGKSFDQSSGAIFNGTYTDITSTTGSASSVTINGSINGTNTTVVAPATGTITIGAGGAIASTTSTFQSGIFTVAPAVASPALPAGSLESTNETINATTINLPIGSMSVLQNGNNGGTLTLTAASIFVGGQVVSASNPLTLNATPVAATAGNGGSISLTLTGVTAASIGGASSPYIFNAPGGAAGGNGGSIYVKNGGLVQHSFCKFTPKK